MFVENVGFRFPVRRETDIIRIRVKATKESRIVAEKETDKTNTADFHGETIAIGKEADRLFVSAWDLDPPKENVAEVLVNGEKVGEVPAQETDEPVWQTKEFDIRPLLQRPTVQAGLGVIGVGAATGIIGRWLGWW